MRKRYCYLCKNKVETIEPTDTAALNRYVTFFGAIEPRSKTRLCQKHHKIISKTIKKTRDLDLKLGGED
ncbi:MAG: 30S ribosomal protein S18 [Candidatus Berkelbacteria bacterium]|nr:30S ribosomal protein S18 [Candidatus Berkelbacteria bacterium]